jgi:hypothetical protein
MGQIFAPTIRTLSPADLRARVALVCKISSRPGRAILAPVNPAPTRGSDAGADGGDDGASVNRWNAVLTVFRVS